MMKQTLTAVAAAVVMAMSVPGIAQESRATRSDAERMVRKGVEFLKKNGKDAYFTSS